MRRALRCLRRGEKAAGQFVPAVRSDCDTPLMSENDSQPAKRAFPLRIVKNITGFPGRAAGKGWMFFVKNIAIAEKACKTAPFCPGRRVTKVAEFLSRGRPKKSLRAGSRLARMLLPQSIAMTAEFNTTKISCRCMMAALQRPVAKPRGLFDTPSFFCSSFMRDSFHKSVGTHSRPLRGGKEGSVCRVM